MVIAHSYVSLPEGTHETFGFNPVFRMGWLFDVHLKSIEK